MTLIKAKTWDVIQPEPIERSFRLVEDFRPIEYVTDEARKLGEDLRTHEVTWMEVKDGFDYDFVFYRVVWSSRDLSRAQSNSNTYTRFICTRES